MCESKTPARSRRPFQTGPPWAVARALDELDVPCLGSLVTGLGVIGDLCALGERTVAVTDDRRVMNEQVLRLIVRRDEPKALVVAEPLDGASSHLSSSNVDSAANAEIAEAKATSAGTALLGKYPTLSPNRSSSRVQRPSRVRASGRSVGRAPTPRSSSTAAYAASWNAICGAARGGRDEAALRRNLLPYRLDHYSTTRMRRRRAH